MGSQEKALVLPGAPGNKLHSEAQYGTNSTTLLLCKLQLQPSLFSPCSRKGVMAKAHGHLWAWWGVVEAQGWGRQGGGGCSALGHARAVSLC